MTKPLLRATADADWNARAHAWRNSAEPTCFTTAAFADSVQRDARSKHCSFTFSGLIRSDNRNRPFAVRIAINIIGSRVGRQGSSMLSALKRCLEF